MDEPTEGLAPVIVNQVAEMLVRLGQEGDIDVLVIEQNIGVACSVAEQVAIMVNGKVNRVMDAGVLASDRDLQEALLGVGRHAHDDPGDVVQPQESAAPTAEAPRSAKVYLSNPKVPTRWSSPVPFRVIEQSARTVTPVESSRPSASQINKVSRVGTVYVCGTLDTKGDELRFMRDIIKSEGVRVALVDLSTSGKPSGADVPPTAVAGYHPRGSSGVFTGDRGTAVAGMTVAFERWIRRRSDVAGLVAAGGSGGTALVAPAFRVPPVGVPKMIVSRPSPPGTCRTICRTRPIFLMLHSVADVQGHQFDHPSRCWPMAQAYAVAGMVKARRLLQLLFSG